MLIPDHPDDERLSAFAFGDADAVADAPLAEHVAACTPCTVLVADLRALRVSLADLPDVPPSRPLRLLPEVADPVPSGADRIGGWVRRWFTPILTAGAAVAMVGLVGTAAPALQGGAGGAAPASAAQEERAGEDAGQLGAAASAGEAPAESAAPDATMFEIDTLQEDEDRPGYGESSDGASSASLPAERSPWPMVLFGGVALMVLALLLRWILAPRAG